MNAHDSERIKGLLEELGLGEAPSQEEADVIVLNTCTIRENADNKLYGNLGHLKSLKDRRPGLQIAVGGCMAQKDRGLIQERAPYVDLVFGSPAIARVGELVAGAEPVVVLGDFNVRALALPGFSDPLPRIDQILARGVEFERGPEAWPTERRRLGERTLSDHAPVEAVIAWP
jgi:hypothetical protein